MKKNEYCLAVVVIMCVMSFYSWSADKDAVVLKAEDVVQKQLPIYQDPAASNKKSAVFLLSGEKKPAPSMKFVKELDAGTYEITIWLAGRPVADLPFELRVQSGDAVRFLAPLWFQKPNQYLPLVMKVKHGGGPLTVTLAVSVNDDFSKNWWKNANVELKKTDAAAGSETDGLEPEPELSIGAIKPYTPYISLDRMEIRKTENPPKPFDWRKDMLVALSLDGILSSETNSSELKLEGKKVFSEGKFGQGLYVGEGNWLRLPITEKTLNRNEGTICFWFKPDSDMKDGKYRRMLAIGNEFSLHKDQFDRLSFHIGTKHVTTREVSWKAGTWHHVAVTWKNAEGEGDLGLYLDGDLYSTYLGRGKGFFSKDIQADWLNVASFGAEEYQLNAVIDDLAVFSSALSQNDVRALVGRGASLKEILAGKTLEYFPQVVNLALKKKVIGQYPSLAYCDWSEFTDGEVKPWPYVSCNESVCGREPIWLQVDLGAPQKINTIRLWQSTRGTFYSVKVALSLTGEFKGEEFVVWDTDKNGTYEESPEGKLFVFPAHETRYIRCWNMGAVPFKTAKGYGQPYWHEISVFYDELKK